MAFVKKMSVNRTTPNCHLINPHRYRLARTVARKCKDDNESQRGMAKFDPRHPKPLNRSSPYFEHVMTSRKPTIVQSLIQIGYGVSIPHMRNFAHSNRLLWPHYGIGHAIIFSSCGFFFLLSSFSFFSSPNLSRRRLEDYHTSTHGVALVRIYDACLKRAACVSLRIQDAKITQKIVICAPAPSHNFVRLYLRNYGTYGQS